MSRVISLRLNEADDARLSGAAALHGLSVSTYVKRLIGGGRSAQEPDSGKVLQRLDDLAESVAEVRIAIGGNRPLPALDLPPRAAITARLKERGLPSSTIRQVEAVLDELAGKKTREVSRS